MDRAKQNICTRRLADPTGSAIGCFKNSAIIEGTRDVTGQGIQGEVYREKPFRGSRNLADPSVTAISGFKDGAVVPYNIAGLDINGKLDGAKVSEYPCA
jgi:hypothetical protein